MPKKNDLPRVKSLDEQFIEIKRIEKQQGILKQNLASMPEFYGERKAEFLQLTKKHGDLLRDLNAKILKNDETKSKTIAVVDALCSRFENKSKKREEN